MNFWKKWLGIKKKSKTFELLQSRLEVRQKDLTTEFAEKQKEIVAWLEDRGVHLDDVWQRGTRGALTSVAAGMILLSSGIAPTPNIGKTEVGSPELSVHKIVEDVKVREQLNNKIMQSLAGKLPSTNRPLTLEEEKAITDTLSEVTGIKVAADLEGKRLNTNYGRIGLEQHLPRYPGEKMSEHFESEAGARAYGKSGMTKNKGAFGYFAPNKYALTPQAIEEEKYYAVVQTFLSPGWGKDKSLPAWYKHRKVLIVNPQNGQAVVGDIADSGPGKSTGKNFGGSPELMDSIGIYYGNSKIPVLLFFIDETGGSPKLGPL